MCVDGMRQAQEAVDNLNVLSVSGANAINTLAILQANVIDADRGTLSSGSRIVTFRTAFAAAPFVTATFEPNGRTAAQSRDGDWISVGSVSTTTALFLGSPGGYTFNWVAVGSR